MTPNVALRAVLTAVAVVVLAIPAVIDVGGYVPGIPVVSRFGSFLVSDLPYVAFLAIGALGLIGVALAIGGGRWTKLLAALAVVVLGGVVVAGAAFATTLAAHGAAYDPIRQLGPDPSAPPADERVVFATLEGVDLHADLRHPARWDAQDVAPAEPFAAVLYVHGGGFVGGELGMRAIQLEAFAERHNVLVVDIEYRLSPPARWHDAPADVLCALAWMRHETQALRIDPGRVFVMGESAGGNLALVAAYAAGTGRIESSCGGDPLVPAGVVAIAPAVDLTALWSNPTLWYEGRPLPEAYVGGPPSEYPDRYAAAEPFAYVRADVPPTLLLAGANDQIIPLDQVRRLESELREAGAQVELVVMPFADHGFDGYHDGPGGQLLEGLLPAFIRKATDAEAGA
ncbi:MAG TPA: alpha/beta hydrolase [Candidatus Binatia bacterium]|nr:alpha/beta hydrolase [Candidatus Binatia bacterium]